jgi:ABC-type anion transport system duplicated permease subunit
MDISITPTTRQKGIKGLATAGLIAKGFVYLILGAFALMADFHIGGRSAANTDKAHIFSFLDESFAGQWLLPLLVIGLFCYCIWRSIEGVHAIEDGKKHYPKAARYFASAGVYLLVAVSAAKEFLDKPGKNGDGKQELASNLLSQPFGHWLAGAAALAFAAIGIYQLYYAWSEKYKKHVQRMNRQTDAAPILLGTGKIGYTARGVVWLIIAYLMSRAAFTGRSNDAGDTGKAFSFIEKSTAGSIWLAAIAIGLIAYGIFSIVRARYERFAEG